MSVTGEKSILKPARLKIICIGLILGFVFAFSSGYLANQYMGETKKQRLISLKQAVQIARNSIEPILVDYRNQKISKDNALQQVRNFIRTMIYNDHTGKNYIFMSSYDGIMLVQPFEPEKEMTDMWDLKDAHGVYIIRTLVNVAKSPEGLGYVSYYYQRPGEAPAQEKISYIIGITELDCYIGTGQYMADIRNSQFSYVIKIAGLTFILLSLTFTLVWASMKEIHIQNMMLHRAERELSAIFNHTIQFIGTLTPEGILTKVNRSALQFIAKGERDVLGKPFCETPWWQGEELKNRLHEAIDASSKGKFCRFEGIHKNDKQDAINVDFNLSPICDEKGNIISLLAEGRDVSEQTKVRNDLIKEKAFFNHLIESLPGVFFLFKLEGKQYVMKKWNEQYVKILGYSPDELKDAPITTFVDVADIPTLNNAIKQLLKTGNLTTQFYTQTKDNRLIPILYMTQHIEYFGDSYIVGTGIELTEKIKAEEEKEKLEAMGTLAGGIAHDFNNILTAILGYAELVQKRLPPDDYTRKMQSQVVNAALRAKNLVNQILLFSRQSELNKKPIQLDFIIKEALKLIRSSLPTTIEIRQDVPKDSGTILADATQIHQIIMNLCTNAYHAMRESGGILNVSLTERTILKEDFTYSEVTLSPGTYLRLEVSDTGYGMDRATLSKIFDPYFTTKEIGEGTGLGLSVVHGIVQNCGGTIKVYSEPGQGTSVCIFFPKIDNDISNKAEQPDTVLQTGIERILLVDDDQMIVDLMRTSLTDLGYQISAFSNSQQALHAFSAAPESFDLIITDMTMPKMTGMDLAKKILSIRQQTPIILCTGYSELITREKADAIGIKAFLSKPILREELSRTIREVLEDKI